MKRRWSKKDYFMAANIIKGAYRNFDGGEAVAHNAAYMTITHIKAEFIAIFSADNPAFDIERFNEECNP